MNKKIVSLAVMFSLFLGTTCFAQSQNPSPAPSIVVPKQTIQGADTPVPLGELVDLSLSPIADKDPSLVSSDYKWSIVEASVDKNGQVVLIGKRIRENADGVFFGAGIKNKTLYVNCTCVYLFVVHGDAKDPTKITQISTRTVILSKQIKIGDDTPPPAPGPSPPNPGPTPNFDKGQYDLAKTAYTLAFSKVTDPTLRTKGAVCYGNCYKGLSSEFLTSGANYTLLTALKKVASDGSAAAKSVDPNLIAAWSPFGDALEDVLNGFYEGKKLNTTKDLGIALQEISNGLGQVK